MQSDTAARKVFLVGRIAGGQDGRSACWNVACAAWSQVSDSSGKVAQAAAKDLIRKDGFDAGMSVYSRQYGVTEDLTTGSPVNFRYKAVIPFPTCF